MHATYKTTKYSIPLFFLAVKTNIDYQIAGSFAAQDETTDAISEADSILKSWNNKWKPLAFIVGNCDEEINTIEKNFLGSNNNNNAVLYLKIIYLQRLENLRIAFCTFAFILNYFLAAVTHGCYTNQLSRKPWHAINNGLHSRSFYEYSRKIFKRAILLENLSKAVSVFSLTIT